MTIPKPHRISFYRYLLFMLLLFYVVACAEVPITHRRSLHLRAGVGTSDNEFATVQ